MWHRSTKAVVQVMLIVGFAALPPLAHADASPRLPEASKSASSAANTDSETGGPVAPGDATVDPVAGGESNPQPPVPGADPLQGKIELKARGMLVLNAVYNRRALVPGPYGLWVARPAFAIDQFVLSGADSVLGFKVSGLSYRGWALSASLALSLKSPTPETRNVLAPLFYDLHVALVSSDAYVLVGQFPDIILPFVPATTNGYPGSYLPGVIGFFRPQLRGGARLMLSELFDVRVQGSVGYDVQTFDVAPLTIGGGANIPDLQGRVSVGAGPEEANVIGPWGRAYEIGIGGHFGKRRFGRITGEDAAIDIVDHRTWSIVGDLRAAFPTGTTLRFQAWMGRTLGDYRGGAFQSISGTLGAISADGLWFDLQQAVSDRVTLAGGYGIDNPDADEVSSGQRTRNQAGFANVFWHWSRWLTFAAEISYWRTDWRDEGSSKSWRGEVLTALTF